MRRTTARCVRPDATAVLGAAALLLFCPICCAEDTATAGQPATQKAQPSPAADTPAATAPEGSVKDKATPSTAPAAQAPTVEVIGYNLAISSSDAASQGSVTGEYIDLRPVLRPGEVLEYVPGMVVTQHSGDGKANQYFLRGYNLDHGTDFATTIDGVPVNMPTHAHGQGYMDLNFLIPELVQRMDFQKGPYYAAYGDFSVTGAADRAKP